MQNSFIEKALNTFPFLIKENFNYLDDKTITYTHWNWDYGQALEFQEFCVDFVKENRSQKVFIFCNHPHCFTLGRGLQKGKGDHFETLVDFDPSLEKRLQYPVYRIKRGGGLTFHFPGQWIFYPIINLNHPDYNLKEITYGLLDGVKAVLEEELEIDNLETHREFLGMWRGDRKLASVGIGVKRFVTYHGIAFNIVRDEAIFSELAKINPCGLSSQTYQSLDEVSTKGIDVDQFHRLYFENKKYNLLKSQQKECE